MKKLDFLILTALLLGTFSTARFSYPSGTVVSLAPSRLEILPGQAFTIDIVVTDVVDLFLWQVAVEYDAKIINCTAAWIPESNVFTGHSHVEVPPILNDPTNNGLNYTFFGDTLISGSVAVDRGLLCKLNFTTLGYGQATIRLGTIDNPVVLFKPNPFSLVNYTQITCLLDSSLAEMPFVNENAEVLSGSQVMLTILPGSGGATDPASGNYTYTAGTNVSVTGIPNSNYVFDHWLLNTIGEYANPLNLTMNFNYTLQPFFMRESYTLTVLESPNGTTNILPGEHVYYGGEIAQIIATANSGYRFDHWILNGSDAGSNNPFNLLLDGNYRLLAVFSIASYVGTVYIRAEGNVDPSSAPVSTLDNTTYMVTKNMDSMIVIQRSNVVLDGNWHTLQGSGSGEGVSLFGVSNVTVKNLSICGFGCGMYLFWASHNVVISNNITGNSWLGLRLYYSSSNSICDNSILTNKDDGIRLEFSSDHNTIVDNNFVSNNWLGICIDSSYGNSFYHNNLVNNSNQVGIDPHNLSPNNIWDDGKEGNYWSNYIGSDTNYDGVGDTPYTIDSDNIDHHPLIGTFSSFRSSSACSTEILSNSTITNFNFSTTERIIRFDVQGQSDTIGFCKMSIPHELVGPDHLQILIDDGNSPSLHLNRNLHDNLTHRCVYFAYNHSIHTIVIQEDTIPPMILILSPGNQTYNSPTVSLTFFVNETVIWSSYSLDSSDNITSTENVTLQGLTEGSHSLIVYASDSANNTGKSAEIFFVVDCTPPNVISTTQYPPPNSVLPGDNVDINVTIIDNVTAVEKAVLTYTFTVLDGAGNDSITMTQVSPNVWAGTIPKFPYNTNVTYSIEASDNAGNTIITERLGYKNEYTVMPEYTTTFIPFLLTASLLAIILFAKKKAKAHATAQ